MNSISKNGYINKLDDMDNKHNNTYHSTIKLRLIDVKSSTHKENNEEDPKFKVGDPVRILKYKNIFAKCYTLLQSEEVLKKLKILCLGHMLLMIKTTKNVLERYTKKNSKKQIEQSLELKK